MWAGTLAFGPTEIPVRLAPATRPRELAFRQTHVADGGRIAVRRGCTACGAEVSYADVAKAYQRPDGALVPLTDEDLASLPLEASHRIDVRSFTSPGTIDPLLISRSYFLSPDARSHNPGHTDTSSLTSAFSPASTPAPHAYAIFREALARTGQTAIATITLRQREAQAAVWPRGHTLVLQTLLTPDEITAPPPTGEISAPLPSDAGPAAPLPAAAPADAELTALADRITALTRDFDPATHHDRYRDQLEALIRARYP